MGTGKAGRMRASHADREQAIEALKVAFVQGRLDKHEFDARVGRVFASRTYLELTAVTADIPPAPAPARPLPAERLPARRPPVSRSVKSGLTVMAVGTALAASIWTIALITQNATALLLAMTITIAYAGTLILGGSVMLDALPRKRTPARPLSPPPLGQIGIR
jgi:DNA-binding NarL/FixJ family response regulator